MTTTDGRLIRSERRHLDVLRSRLAHLRVDDPARKDDPAYPPGEANALTWVLSVVEGQLEPVELRVERLERSFRIWQSRVGNLERDYYAEEDGDEDSDPRDQ